MTSLKIAGTGRYLPEQVLDNQHFVDLPALHKYARDSKGQAEITETYAGESKITLEAILKSTGGILTRRKSRDDEFPWDLGCNAARIALDKSGVSAENLAGVIVATLPHARNIPSVACRIGAKLGIKPGISLDINYACAGFSAALNLANALNQTNPGNYLVVAAECITKIVDAKDYNSILFGDGAGAAVLMPSEEGRGILKGYFKSDSLEGNVSAIESDSNNYLRMFNGRDVLKEAILDMVESARVLKTGLEWEKADVYIPHQANGRIIEGVAKRVSEEGSIVYRNIERYGNMSAATCAVALDEALETGIIKPGHKVIITGFGAGFVTAATAIQF